MAMHDDDDQKPKLDPDRAAILERRKRFIALALSGLSTAACTPGPGQSKPEPCLKGGAPGQVKEDEGEQGDEGPAPQPCLSVPIRPEPLPDPQPQVCLKMAMPPPADTGGIDTGGIDTGETDTGEAAPEPVPRPCLSKPAPKPCLKQAPPQPCLKMPPPG
jgi:hypothetical protein